MYIHRNLGDTYFLCVTGTRKITETRLYDATADNTIMFTLDGLIYDKE